MRLSDAQVACLLVAGANKRLIERSWLIDAFTLCDKYTVEIETDHVANVGHAIQVEHLKYPELKLGSIVRVNSKLLGCVLEIENDLARIEILSDGKTPCFSMTDVFDVDKQTVARYLGGNKFSADVWGDTTVGRYLWNVITLGYPFDFAVFGYVNKLWKPKKIVELVKNELTVQHITVDHFEKFFDYLYFIGHITELSTPSMTVKSLETNPNVTELKRKFIEEHAGQMNDPVVIHQLEEMLVAADKEYLGNDPSTVFFDGLGEEEYTKSRKKIFLTVGGIPAFDNSSTKMDFIPNSLMEGWTIDALPSIANEIRKGSYDRGVETAKGGAETKLLFRAFQDVIISEEDCGTTRTIEVDCSVADPKQFIGRTIRVNGKDIELTRDNIEQYTKGGIIHMYSPLTCETKGNFCYKCCGSNTKKFGAKYLGINSVKISSRFMMLAMKNMHGTVLTIRGNDLKDIVL